MRTVAAIALCLLLAGCYEAGSTYSDKSDRYVSTSEYKARYHVTRVCQSTSCWDDKAGHLVARDEWNSRERGQ